ncbi:hypothetical protein [Variovorax sp. GT1P44]|uniref:hypothetical protein n=1 Tax=Variovorax sp. GT1P44 TaxID=3443742 RepID=UPI003F48C4D6
MKYDRELLLLGEKRNDVLDLHEVQQYGLDSYDDADYVSLYGLAPADWFAKGIRVLGRTAVECTRDRLAAAIAADVAFTAAGAHAGSYLVIDPFVGSGNTLYWLLQHLPGAAGVAFENDASVSRLTSSNVALLSLSLQVLNIDFKHGLPHTVAAPDQLVVAFIAPPWGRALDPETGLDLSRTEPPVEAIVERFSNHFQRAKLLCAVQVHERVKPVPLAKLATQFDWTGLKTYGFNRPGQNHGIFLGSKGWTPTHV